MNVFRLLEIALILAGLAQLGVASSSVFIPRLLGWREETKLLRPLTRQVFWTYSVYILSINSAFGLLSLLAPHLLIDGSTLESSVHPPVTFESWARASSSALSSQAR